MFLRKLVVIVFPLALAAVLCVLPGLTAPVGYWANILLGLPLGAGLALLPRVAGAARKRMPFSRLLWVPAVLLLALLVLSLTGVLSLFSLWQLVVLSTLAGALIVLPFC